MQLDIISKSMTNLATHAYFFPLVHYDEWKPYQAEKEKQTTSPYRVTKGVLMGTIQ